jgi:glycosyltransferase involved in cell wall biosynthesis
MKITVTSLGRFHSFDLAAQLHRLEVLDKLITVYPKKYVKKWGIPKDKVISLLPYALFHRYIPRILPKRYRKWYNATIQELYSKIVSHIIPKNSDCVIAWSGNALEIIRKAKKLNMISIVERGSSHIVAQEKLLQDEYKKRGIYLPNIVHPKTIRREITEYNEADYISILSTFAKNTFIENGIKDTKLLVNPCGVDLSSFRQIKKDDDVFRIIHCGGISLRKGAPYLLQAFYELDLPDSELWLIGSMDDGVVQYFKKYNNGRVMHKGPYLQSELYKYYSQGSIFSINSVEEGLGMVVLQAMACGLPVLCSDNTGGKDFITPGIDGFVVPTGDVEVLKEKILYFYENLELCKVMGKAALEKVASGFSWDDYGKRYLENLKQIIKNEQADL